MVQIVADSVTVRVPATSANLGPGFDCLGLACAFYDEVTVRPVMGRTHVHVDGVGAGRVATNESNLVVRALRAGLDAVGAPLAGFDVRCRNRIPHGGGMGSSAAAVVAGLTAAQGLISHPELLDRQRILEIATQFEGHPDNVAPAIFGGATVSWCMSGGGAGAGTVRHVPITVDPQLPVTFLIPPEKVRLSTAAARGVLPETVSRSDALFNVARASALVVALGGQFEALMDATEDRLHQDARRSVLPMSTAVMDSLRDQGYPAVISGAGPTVLLFGLLDDAPRGVLEDAGWVVLEPGIDHEGATIIG